MAAFLEKRPPAFTGASREQASVSQALADACAAQMWEGDAASRGLGMALEPGGAGRGRLSMPVTAAMLNGHGTCHGGFIFALADSAFAFACNTDGMASVAAHCAISYLRPARLGDAPGGGTPPSGTARGAAASTTCA